MFSGHICLSLISYFVRGRVIGKIKQNELDCCDTTPLMSSLTWIAEKELEREIKKERRRISLETQHENFKRW